jgi:hypothetical protein
MSSALTVMRPLKPQRWGFWPTSEFWDYALTRPAGFAMGFAGMLAFFVAQAMFFGTAPFWLWAVPACLWSQVWLGIVERWVRGRARRRR